VEDVLKADEEVMLAKAMQRAAYLDERDGAIFDLICLFYLLQLSFNKMP